MAPRRSNRIVVVGTSAGGLDALRRTVVQDPKDAAYPEMPRSALSADVEHCFSLRGIGARLDRLAHVRPRKTRPLPDNVKLEALIAERVLSDVHAVNELDTQVPYNGPGCGGVLWQVEKSRTTRYRCHVGHSIARRARARVLERTPAMASKKLRPGGPRRSNGAKPTGIAPTLLLEQVKSTAPWVFGLEPPLPASSILANAADIERRWRAGGGGEAYFVALLAAHFTTVATFCPTDVDVRIRQHSWAELAKERLASAVTRVEEVASWPVPPVTARHVVIDGEVLAGHQGEWFSVMAGALGRALALSDASIVERTTAWIEAELTREARLVSFTRKHGTTQELLSVVTTVAHNVGDLSRVVDTWPTSHAASERGLRYRRLGHEDGARFDGAFVYAGNLNKERMALENHRFLPLRSPRALRRERAFLLPFGPYFHAWGRLIGSTKLVDDAERAEILLALVRMHELRGEEQGCLRAIAGMNETVSGGVDKLARLWPAEQRGSIARGGLRIALRRAEVDFLETFHAGITR